jgi:DNA-binding LacI/PurR family transcriptional regulator
MAKVTQTKIAKELGISQSTISLVLANPATRRVSDKTRTRIFEYIRKIDPSFTLTHRPAGDICYLTPANGYTNASLYTRLLDGAEAEAKAQGLNLLFKRWQTPADFPDIFSNSTIAGIIHCGETSEEVIRQLQQFAPTVLLNHTFESLICNMVTIDNHGAIRQAIRHCYNMGHRRIGYVTNQKLCHAGHFLDRLGGYYEAMHTLGLPIHADDLFEFDGTGHKTSGPVGIIRQLMNMKNRPTALVCANDNIAIALMKEAASAGLKLPEDLSITGFDNTETGREWQPALTTIHQRREDMGRAAVALLTRKIKNEGDDIPEKILCAAELIVRKSVAKITIKNQT